MKRRLACRCQLFYVFEFTYTLLQNFAIKGTNLLTCALYYLQVNVFCPRRFLPLETRFNPISMKKKREVLNEFRVGNSSLGSERIVDIKVRVFYALKHPRFIQIRGTCDAFSCFIVDIKRQTFAKMRRENQNDKTVEQQIYHRRDRA